MEGWFVDKAEADAELEMDGWVARTELGMRVGKVRPSAEAGGPPSAGYRLIA